MSEEVILDITTVEETVTIDTTAPDVVQINVLAVTGGATTWDEIEDKPTEFPPSPHTHGNISNAGAIGSTADLVAVTGSGGVLTTASRSGIDSRTEFPPAAHTQGWDTLTGTVDIVPFTTTNGGPTATGELGWLASTESLALRLKNGENLDVGEEVVYHVDNNTGSTIAKGTAVSYAGTVGGSGKIRVKPWNGSTDAPEAFIGFAMGAIPNGEAGYVTAFGVIRGVNTSAFSDGVTLYANPAGTGLTATKPSTTHVIACLCVNASNNGTILVRPTVDKITGWDDVTGKPTEFTPAPHTHGNITNDGRIGTTADLVAVTGTGGVLTTVSRSGIDSRTSFPNADVAAATENPIDGRIVKRSADGVVGLYAVELSGFGGIIGVGNNVQISLQGANSTIETQFGNSPIQTLDPTSNIITRGSFVLNGGANAITLSGAPTANRTITVPDASGTLALISTAGQNFLNSPTSANLATLLTDENGTGGGFVRAEGATLTSPTIAGTAQFSGTTRPTTAGTGVPASSSLISREDSHTEQMRNMSQLMMITPPEFATTTASGGFAGQGGGFLNMVTGTTASAYARAVITSNIGPFTNSGTRAACSVPVAFAFSLIHTIPTSANTEYRFVAGEIGTGNPIALGTSPLDGRGFGFRVYWSVANSRIEIQVFAHNGATYTESAPVAFGTTTAESIPSIMISSDGAGTIKLFVGVPSPPLFAHVRVPDSPIITLIGGPTDATYFRPNFSHIVQNGATPPSAQLNVRPSRCLIHTGTIY